MHSLLYESRKHLLLALPVGLGHLGQQLLAITDSAIVGHHNTLELAGVGVANTVLVTAVFVGVGILLGLDALIPQALGRGDAQHAKALLSDGLRLALWLSIAICILGLFSPFLFRLFSLDDQVSSDATAVLWARLPWVFPYLAYCACLSYAQAIGQTRAIVISVILGNGVNIVLDIVFVRGVEVLSIPPMGALGASLSTCIVGFVMALYLAKICGVFTRVRLYTTDVRIIRSIVRVGWPIGGQLLAEFGIFALMALLAGKLGLLAASAHQIAFSIITFAYAFGIGMGSASAVRVGRAIGAGHCSVARRRGQAALLAGIPLAVGSIILLLAAPSFLLRFFTSDGEVIAVGETLLHIAALFQFADLGQAILSGVLRGTGATRRILTAHFFGHYIIGLPLALFFTLTLNWGCGGLWVGLGIGLHAVFLMLAIFFYSMGERS